MNKNKPFPSTILQILAAIFGSVLVSAILLIIIPIETITISNDVFENQWFSNSMIVYIVFTLIIIITVATNAITKHKLFVTCYKFKHKWHYLVVFFILIVLAHFLVIVPFESLISNGPDVVKSDLSVVFALTTFLISPILEEIIFRGIFLSGLLNNYSPKYAVIISSLFFGLFHFDIYAIFGAFVVGILLSILYIRTEHNLFMCILCHIGVNLLPLTRCYQLQIYENAVINVLLLSICFASIIIIYFVRKRNCKHHKVEEEQKQINLVGIRAYSNRISAEIAKSSLESAGIPCILDGEVSFYPDFNAQYPIYLKVREKDAILAEQILDFDNENDG